MTFTPDSGLVIAAADDSDVHIWDVANESERILESRADWIDCLTATPNSKYVLSGSDDGTLKLRDLDRTSGHL